jgi:argininosuccinate lyase
MRLIDLDLTVIKTHCQMLHKQKYLTITELKNILSALSQVAKDTKSGKLNIKKLAAKYKFTDVHPIIEKYIIDKCGIDVGGKTNLGKSRNDQVMADIRLYLVQEQKNISVLLLQLVKTLVLLSQKHVDTVMPAYTHMQPGQATTVAHYLLSYVSTLLRSHDRLQETGHRMNLNPLGACAIAGTTINIDRNYTTKQLGYSGIIENSTDAVSNRDFMLEFASELAIIMTTLSRIAEDLIVWSTPEFGFVELADEFTDTSTAMPQKKNPSTMELLRGKTATVISSMTELFIIVKGLPTGYNQDLQQMKPAMWRLIDEVNPSLSLMTKLFSTIKINKHNMLKSAVQNNVTAIDLAEYLTQKKYLSFRQAHFLVGSLVKQLITVNDNLTNSVKQNPDKIKYLVNQLSQKLFNKMINITVKELQTVLDPVSSIRNKRSIGSPSPVMVKNYIKKLKI